MRYHLELLSRPAGLPVHFLVQWLLLFKLAGLCSMTEKPCAFGEHTHTIKKRRKGKTLAHTCISQRTRICTNSLVCILHANWCPQAPCTTVCGCDPSASTPPPPKRAPGVKNRPLAWKVNRALCLWRRRSGEIKRIQRRPQQLSCAFMFWLVTRRLREPSGRNKSPPLPQTEAWFCTTVYHSYYTRKMQRTLHTSDPTRRSYLFHYASFVSSASVTVDIFFPALLWLLSATSWTRYWFMCFFALFIPDCVEYIGVDLIVYICCTVFFVFFLWLT